jgi:hypothetical protein
MFVIASQVMMIMVLADCFADMTLPEKKYTNKNAQSVK